jgi:hypothetical protein
MFWEELVAYFRFIRHEPHRKRLQQIFVAAGTSLPSCYLANIGGHKDTHRHTCPTILFLCIFVAARMCLPIHCLATKGRIHIQTHRLMGGIYEEHRWDWFRCHYMHTKFHKDWFKYSKVNGGKEFTGTCTQTAWRAHKPTLISSKWGK